MGIRIRTRRKAARRQLDLAARTRGGWRANAGRKRIPTRRRTTVAHRRRSSVSSYEPQHVTWRALGDVPPLRRPRVLRWIRRCLELAQRENFRVVHFAILRNHLHLIVEADDRDALSRGLQGLGVRLAKRLNRLFGRKGKLFVERYHDTAARDPKQARAMLLYVLNNARRHAAQRGRRLARGWLDPYSSAHAFDGWSRGLAEQQSESPWIRRPRTWLLREGWRRHGLLDPDAVPG